MNQASLNLILTYAGRLPNYFSLWLGSCGTNPTVTWTVLTDQEPPCALPPNVRWAPFTVASFIERVRTRLGVVPVIERAYKFCDFKPAMGLLYPELTEGFDYWGHCDPDVIWGDLRRFHPLDLVASPPKVQMRGAFSLYRNDEVGNTLFMLPHPHVRWQDAFTSPRYCGFDEWEGLWRLLKHHRIPCALDSRMAEILVGTHDLRHDGKPNYKPQIFCWRDGRVLRVYWTEQGMQTDEYSYIHLQKRRFEAVAFPAGSEFCILPGRFLPIGHGTDLRKLASLNRSHFMHDLMFQCGRLHRYIRSRREIDRRYYRLGK